MTPLRAVSSSLNALATSEFLDFLLPSFSPIINRIIRSSFSFRDFELLLRAARSNDGGS